ncbi:MAG: hypothetical protein GX446_04375 [Chthonomonadales bacterium]|nr:hypothetical protein [Chthonomonadales bacterium]
MSGTFFAPGLTFDEWAFILTFPPSVGAGETVSGEFYWVSADLSTIPNDYVGTFYVVGGSGDSNEVDVTIRVMGYPVPEFGTLASLIGMVGLGGFGMLRRRLDRRAR